MNLKEIEINITTRYLEKEKDDFLNLVENIISNKMAINDLEFSSILDIYASISGNYKINDPYFVSILDSFSKLVSYHKRTRK
jgi:hypothetical protein